MGAQTINLRAESKSMTHRSTGAGMFLYFLSLGARSLPPTLTVPIRSHPAATRPALGPRRDWPLPGLDSLCTPPTLPPVGR